MHLQPLQKQLKHHFLSLIEGSKIESIRFRSVAFASATTALPTEVTKTLSSQGSDALSTKQQRQQDRAAQWRESTSTNMTVTRKRIREDDDETSEREDSHGKTKKASYLTPTKRKRVAFIKGEFHKAVDTVNAYIVFAYDKYSQKTEIPAGKAAQLHPFEAARVAVQWCDGSLFMDKTIRVDRVGQWRAVSGESTVGDDVGGFGDPRVTLFVGNLDFAAREEDLRVWFEGVVSQERGPPPEEDGHGGEQVGAEGAGGQIPRERRKRWVCNVRIVRDRDTQLGKGFAYVRFLVSFASNVLRPTKVSAAHDTYDVVTGPRVRG
jgi:nucleolar protein 12